MSYSIQYTQGAAYKTALQENVRNKNGKIKVYILLLIAVLFLVASCLEWNADFLIPGDREITKAAFLELVKDVEMGENVKAAITAFCKEVISGADAGKDTDIH